MKENCSQSLVDKKAAVSRTFERAWRIRSRPQDHSLEQVRWARDFVLEQYDNWNVAINSPGYPVPSQELDMVFAGLFHHGITSSFTIGSDQN